MAKKVKENKLPQFATANGDVFEFVYPKFNAGNGPLNAQDVVDAATEGDVDAANELAELVKNKSGVIRKIGTAPVPTAPVPTAPVAAKKSETTKPAPAEEGAK